MKYLPANEEWSSSSRKLYWLYLSVLVALLVYLLVGVVIGNQNGLDWYVTSSTEIVKVPIKIFNLGIFQIDLFGDNYLVNQHFTGSPYAYEMWRPVVQVLVLGLAISMLLTVFSYLSTFWFTVSMGIFLVVLMALQLDQLMLFGLEGNSATFGIAGIYLVVSFYFNKIATDTELLKRWIAFLGLTILVGVAIMFASEVESPIWVLSNFGILGAVVLSIIFILLIGHEIVYLILYLVTRSSPQYSKHNAAHFTVFTLIYLGNVGLAYAKAARYIDWNILYVNAFVLLTISILVGLWSFQKKEEAYSKILPFNPLVGLLYLALAIVTVSTISYLIAVGNDPLLETMEDAILFTHIAYGAMFFIYIMANFITPMIRNMQVYKIAFKDGTFPYATANLGGLIVVLALYFMGDQVSFNQAIAGMYNLQGDVVRESNPNFAKQLYIQSTNYGFNNHRANYTLGIMETAEKQTAKAIGYYKSAVAKHPTPQAYINLANLYRDNNAYFESMFKLQEAVVKFPDNGPINNNLAILFSKTNIVDSTLFYLNAVTDNDRAERTAQVNLLSLYAKKGLVGDLDSLIGVFNNKEADLALKANLLAFGNLNGKKIEGTLAPEKSADSLLNLHEFAYLANGSVSGINQWEVEEAAYKSWQNNPYNGAYNEAVGFADAWSSYKAGKIEPAFRQLDFLGGNISAQQGYYRHIAGVLALEQRAYYLAVQNFDAASNLYVKDHENMAFANLELGQVAAAMPHVNQIADQTKREMLVTAALLSAVEVPETNDQVRYLALRYRYRTLSDVETEAIFETFDDILYREYAALMLVRKYLDGGNVLQAEKIMAKIPFGSEQKTENERELLFDCIRQAKNQQVELTLQDLNLMGITDESVINYYKAKSYESQNDTANATQAYRLLGKRNPFAVESILAAAAYFNKINNRDEAYSILQEALSINEYSVPLIKGYIDQAIQLNLPQYADAMVIKLIDLLPAADYIAYEAEVKAKLQEMKNRQADWEF